MRRGVEPLVAAADHRDGRASGPDGRGVGRAVDPEREARHDGRAEPATAVADPARGRAAVLRGPPRADDRHGARRGPAPRRSPRTEQDGRREVDRSGGATGRRRRASVSTSRPDAPDRLEQPRRVLRRPRRGPRRPTARGSASRRRRRRSPPTSRRGAHRGAARPRGPPRRSRTRATSRPNDTGPTPSTPARTTHASRSAALRPPLAGDLPRRVSAGGAVAVRARSRPSGPPRPMPEHQPASRERGPLGRRPEPRRLVEVRRRHHRRAVEVRDRPGDPQQALRAPAGQAARAPRAGSPARVSAARGRTHRAQPAAADPPVGQRRRCVPAGGRARRRSAPRPSADDSGAGPSTSSAGGTRADRHPQVDPVPERPRDPAPVPLRDARRAGAATGPRRPACRTGTGSSPPRA